MKLHYYIITLAFFTIGPLSGQVTRQQEHQVRNEFFRALTSIGQTFSDAESKRFEGIDKFAKTFSKEDQNELNPRLMTRDMDRKFVTEENVAIIEYVKKGDHYTAAYQTGKLIAAGQTLASDFLVISASASDGAEKSAMMKMYNHLKVQLAGLEFAFQQYYGQLSWAPQE